MARDIKKLKYEPGDKVDTSDRPMRCPNGHTLSVRRNVKAGQGRIFCSQCSWSDKQQVIGAEPVGGAPGSPFSKPDPRTGGVTVMSQRGVERRGRPNVIGGR